MTSSISATSAQLNSVGLTQMEGLTPDGLVLYLQSQLGDIDARIDRFMQKQQLIQDQRKELNVIANALAETETPKEGETTDVSVANRGPLNDAIANLEALGFDKETVKKLEEAKLTGMSPAALEGMQTTVENAIKDLESSASLDMIQLQSCVQQRNTCISLATNLMSAVGKGEESIAGNIGR